MAGEYRAILKKRTMRKTSRKRKSLGNSIANQNGSTATRSMMPAVLSAYLMRERACGRCRCGPCSTAHHNRKAYSMVNTTREKYSIHANAVAERDADCGMESKPTAARLVTKRPNS